MKKNFLAALALLAALVGLNVATLPATQAHILPGILAGNSSFVVDCGNATVTTAPNGDSVCTYITVGSSSFSVISGSGYVWYLAVGGGGGGGTDNGGGGGGGGLLTNGSATYTVTAAASPYTTTVGAGGHGATADADPSTNGGNSVFGSFTATGGGRGGSNSGTDINGSTGGSGGGGANGGTGAAGTAGQGTAGGNGGGVPSYPAGGGGGATSVGANNSGNNGGAGGAGTASSISGSSVTYAGGGGGASHATGGAGGAGGGGAGASGIGANGTPGTANTGGGSGGSAVTTGGAAHDGGSGVVIIRCTCTVQSDPYYSSVTLLAINNNAANASTTVIDQSSAARSLTAQGNAAWSTTSPPTGLISTAALDGTGDAVTAASSNLGAFGTGALTVEVFIKPNSPSVDSQIVDFRDAGGGWALVVDSADATKFGLFNGTSVIATSTTAAIPNSTWRYIAWTRDGSGNNTLWSNAASVATASDSTNYGTNRPTQIGYRYDAGFGFAGNVAAVRITSGIARTVSAVPTLPLPSR